MSKLYEEELERQKEVIKTLEARVAELEAELAARNDPTPISNPHDELPIHSIK